jgi:hypothetical protein
MFQFLPNLPSGHFPTSFPIKILYAAFGLFIETACCPP